MGGRTSHSHRWSGTIHATSYCTIGQRWVQSVGFDTFRSHFSASRLTFNLLSSDCVLCVYCGAGNCTVNDSIVVEISVSIDTEKRDKLPLGLLHFVKAATWNVETFTSWNDAFNVHFVHPIRTVLWSVVSCIPHTCNWANVLNVEFHVNNATTTTY